MPIPIYIFNLTEAIGANMLLCSPLRVIIPVWNLYRKITIHKRQLVGYKSKISRN